METTRNSLALSSKDRFADRIWGGDTRKHLEFVRQRLKKSGDGFETRSSPVAALDCTSLSLSAPFADLHECNLQGVSVRRHFRLTGVRHRRPTIVDSDAVVTFYSPPLVGWAFAIPTARSPSQFARTGLLLLPRDAQQCFPSPRSSFAVFEIH